MNESLAVFVSLIVAACREGPVQIASAQFAAAGRSHKAVREDVVCFRTKALQHKQYKTIAAKTVTRKSSV